MFGFCEFLVGVRIHYRVVGYFICVVGVVIFEFSGLLLRFLLCDLSRSLLDNLISGKRILSDALLGILLSQRCRNNLAPLDSQTI